MVNLSKIFQVMDSIASRELTTELCLDHIMPIWMGLFLVSLKGLEHLPSEYVLTDVFKQICQDIETGKDCKKISRSLLSELFPRTAKIAQMDFVTLQEILATFTKHLFNCSECKALIKKYEQSEEMCASEKILDQLEKIYPTRAEIEERSTAHQIDYTTREIIPPGIEKATMEGLTRLKYPADLDEIDDCLLAKEKEAMQALYLMFFHDQGQTSQLKTFLKIFNELEPDPCSMD